MKPTARAKIEDALKKEVFLNRGIPVERWKSFSMHKSEPEAKCEQSKTGKRENQTIHQQKNRENCYKN